MLLVHLDIMFNPIRSIVTENRLIHPSLGIIHHPILVLPSVLSVSWDLVLTCIAHQVANCQDTCVDIVFNILSVIVLTLIPVMSA